MIDAKKENAKMLASILGIAEDEAAARLDKLVLITSATDPASLKWSQEIADQLSRTVHVKSALDDILPDIELLVGSAPPVSGAKTLYAYLSETGAVIGSEPIQGECHETHGLLGAIAACTAAAMVLHAVVDAPELPRVSDPLRLEFADLGVESEWLNTPLDLTGSVLIGAGAVANGFLRALRHLRPKGTLPVIDPKTVGGGNINRCLYFSDADIGKSKATALATAAQPDFPQAVLEPYGDGFSEYCAQFGPVRRGIVTVDSRRTRRSIQKELPWQIVDASTTDIREVIVHSNTALSEGACLACIYRHVPDERAREASIASGLGVSIDDVAKGLINEEIASRIVAQHPGLKEQGLVGMAFDSLFKQLCGEQALKTPEGRQVFAPFAFVSNLAGALLVIELVRQIHADKPLEFNYWSASPWSVPDRRMRRFKPKYPQCEFCSKPEASTVLQKVWKV